MPTDNEPTGPARAGPGGVHPGLVGFALEVWARRTLATGDRVVLWRLLIFAEGCLERAAEFPVDDAQAALHTALCRCAAVAQVALERQG
jgi:hypothetical protein